MTAPKPQSADLLKLAAGLSRASFDKMTHALGWPDTANCIRPWSRGRIRWANPYRNGYAVDGDDPDWIAAQEAGLAKCHPRAGQPYAMWYVTPLGVVIVRLKLRAVVEAACLKVAQ